VLSTARWAWSPVLGCSPIYDKSGLHVMTTCGVCQEFRSADVKTQILERKFPQGSVLIFQITHKQKQCSQKLLKFCQSG